MNSWVLDGFSHCSEGAPEPGVNPLAVRCLVKGVRPLGAEFSSQAKMMWH